MDRVKLLFVLMLLAALPALPAIAGATGEAKDAKMEAWVKAMTPGVPHAGLADQVGEWTYVVTFWTEPGADPMTFKGVASKTMIMGGRYLQEEVTGEPSEHPFRGLGFTGYDNVTKQYVSVWLDNMSTGIPFSTGQQGAKGVQTFKSTYNDPATGRATPTRSISRTIDRDHHVHESYLTNADGTERLHMRVEFTRATD